MNSPARIVTPRSAGSGEPAYRITAWAPVGRVPSPGGRKRRSWPRHIGACRGWLPTRRSAGLQPAFGSRRTESSSQTGTPMPWFLAAKFWCAAGLPATHRQALENAGAFKPRRSRIKSQ